VTVSEFSRGELADALGLDRGRISVVPGGVGEAFTPAADAAAAARALGLERPYVLTVASLVARKNLAALGPAARRLAARGLDLVAAGGGRPQFREEMATAGVRALGHVDDARLPGLYAGAEAFVLASRYEGFGLTCLEAMASGTPVVAADRAALPETCGQAALLVDPEDPEAVAAALERALDDAGLAERLRAAGLARAASLTWDRAARATDAVLAGLGGWGPGRG
jgi:glycosyltransferase involved in cell wall biosynthesis